MALLPAGNGELPLEKAFGFTIDEISTCMKKIAANPQAWGVATEYIPSPGIKEATERVISHIDRKIVWNYEDPPLALKYKGEQLPVNTAFDHLGWILSVCGSGPPGATAKNYYLPMLALYSRWCYVLGGSKFEGMTHITWFTDSKSKSTDVLLGATLGQPETRDTVSNTDKVTGQPLPRVKDRGLIMRRERIEYLEKAGFRAPDISIPQTEDMSKQKNQKDGTQGDPGFGGCAETFFFIVAMKNKIDKANVHGFALRPTVDLMKQLSTYSESAVVAQLRPPCDYSCQILIYQMYNTKDWQSMFDYKTIVSREGGGATGLSGSGVSATAKAGSSTGPGAKAGAASSKAGSSGKESGFQAKMATGLGAAFSPIVTGNIKK